MDETEYLLSSPRNARRLPEALGEGRELTLDRAAIRKDLVLPAFLAKPPNAPVYYGFEILHDVVVDGFTFGAITDFEARLSEEGDAFVIAPDDSRAGLVWTVSKTPQFEQILAPAKDRWGVWAVSFPFEMTSRENVRLNLAANLPLLKTEWERWQASR